MDAGYRFFVRIFKKKRGILESLIKPENDSTNRIERLAGTLLPT